MGWSASGLHALACTYKIPERVLSGAIISDLAPLECPQPFANLPLPNKMLMMLSCRTPSLVYLFQRINQSMIMGDSDNVAEKLASFLPEQYRKLVMGTEYQQLFVLDIQEGYRPGWRRPAQDDILINSPRDFNIEEIRVRIDIWQGEVDKNVPSQPGLIPA